MRCSVHGELHANFSIDRNFADFNYVRVEKRARVGDVKIISSINHREVTWKSVLGIAMVNFVPGKCSRGVDEPQDRLISFRFQNQIDK